MERRKFFKSLMALPFIPLMGWGREKSKEIKPKQYWAGTTIEYKDSFVVKQHLFRKRYTDGVVGLPIPIFEIHPFDMYELVNSLPSPKITVKHVSGCRLDNSRQLTEVDGVRYWQTTNVIAHSKGLI